MTFRSTGSPDVTVGYYPIERAAYAAGVVRNDAVSEWADENGTTLAGW
jgi:hypothetical protein